MRVSDEDLERFSGYVAAGPNWTPSEIDGFVEPQACLSRRQAENLITDLRDLREKARAVDKAYHKACMSRGAVGIEFDAIEDLRAELK